MKRESIKRILAIILVVITMLGIAPIESFASSVNGTSITSVANSYQGIKIKWKKSTNADGYIVSRKVGKSGEWKKLATTTKLEYLDTSVAHKRTYYYRIKAYRGSKTKSYSSYCKSESKKFISAPEVTSAKEREGFVLVSFKEVKDAKYYYIYRKTGKNGTYKCIDRISKAGRYEDWNCQSKKTYYYAVKAEIDGVKSGHTPGKKCVITYYAGDCDCSIIDHKKVIEPTEALYGYTINYCKCERAYQISNIKKPINRTQANGNLPAYSEAVKRDNASVSYLNKVLKNDRVDLLQIYFGSTADIRVLKKLSDKIVAGCKTDQEKAYALYDWIINNISYNAETGQHSCDVMRYREGDCSGMTNLLVDCLRLQGIPAATITGYVGDTKNVFTINNMDEVSGNVGHEWARAYVGGEWVFIDCTFQRYITSKDDFNIPAWYYAVSTDGAIPYYKGMNFKYSIGYPVYINGKYYCFDEKGVEQLNSGGTGVIILPDLMISFAACGVDSNINDPKQLMCREFSCDAKNYLPGQYYTNTKVARTSKAMDYQGYITQTYYNGREVSDTAFSYNGKGYISNGWMCYKDYSGKNLSMKCSSLALQKGEKITLYPNFSDLGQYKLRWSSDNTRVATVDQNGVVTIKGDGDAEISCKGLTSDGRVIFDVCAFINVGDKKYIIKDSDMAPLSSIKLQRSKIKKPGLR